MNPAAVLTNRIGPLPAWAWGGIAGGGILAFRLWRSRREAATDDAAATIADETTTDSGGVTVAAVARPDLLGGRDTAGWPATGSSAPDPNAGYVDTTPPDWVTTPPAWFYDLPGQLLNQPPINIVLPEPPAADVGPGPAAPAPAPAPAAAPAVHYLPTLGPWAAKPKSVPAGYRIVRRGDGKYIAVDDKYRGS